MGFHPLLLPVAPHRARLYADNNLPYFRGEIPKGKHFEKSNFEKIRFKVFETFLVLEGLFCDVLIKNWYQKEA